MNRAQIAAWLTAWLDEHADDVSDADAIVFDAIREELRRLPVRLSDGDRIQEGDVIGR